MGMPVLKSISGHTSCRGVIRYLTKEGRELAHDLINLVEPCDDVWGERPVWKQMDDTRANFGNDSGRGSLRCRTYEHFILSPDPLDVVSLDTLREIACGWARQNFGDYEVAIYYHDDNEAHIPHAHVIVNNTNLVTGRRLAPTLTRGANARIFDDLQARARRHGLRAFKEGRGQGPRGNRSRGSRSMATHEIDSSGRYSWVEDIRRRVDCAVRMARSEDEFKVACAHMGVGTEMAQGRNHGDFVYSLDGHKAWRITGRRLGSSWTRFSVGRRIANARAGRVPVVPEPVREALARAMVDLSRGGGTPPEVIGVTRDMGISARDVSDLLDLCAREGIRSMGDLRDAAVRAPKGSRDRASRLIEVARAMDILPEDGPSESEGGGARVGHLVEGRGGHGMAHGHAVGDDDARQVAPEGMAGGNRARERGR